MSECFPLSQADSKRLVKEFKELWLHETGETLSKVDALKYMESLGRFGALITQMHTEIFREDTSQC